MAYQSIFGPDEKVDNSGGYRSLFDTNDTYEEKRKKRRDEIAAKMVQEEQDRKQKEEKDRQEREQKAKEKITPKEYGSVWERLGDKFEANSQQDKAKRLKRGDVEKYQDQQAIQDGYKKRDYTNADRAEAITIKADLDKRLRNKEITTEQYTKEFADRGMSDRPNYTTTPTVEDITAYKKQRAGEVKSLVEQRKAEGKPLKDGQITAMLDDISNVDTQYEDWRKQFERDKPRSLGKQIIGGFAGNVSKGFLRLYGDALTVTGAGLDFVDGNAADGVADTLKKGGKNWRQGLNDFYEASDFAQSSIAGENSIVGNASQAAGSLASSLLTGNVAGTSAAATQFGVIAGVDTYDEMQAKGLSNTRSVLTAIPRGVFEAGLEKVGLDNYMGLLGKKALGETIRGFAVEGSQELTQSLVGSAVDATHRKGGSNLNITDPNSYWSKALMQAGEEGMYGGLAGGMGNVAGVYSNSLIEKGAPKDIAQSLGLRFQQRLEKNGNPKLAAEDNISDAEVKAGEDLVSQDPIAPVENPIGLPEATVGDAVDGTIGPIDKVMDSVVDIAPPPSGPSDIPGTNIEAGVDSTAVSDISDGTTRPDGELQTKIEKAKLAGDTEQAKKLESQLKDQAENPDAPQSTKEEEAKLMEAAREKVASGKSVFDTKDSTKERVVFGSGDFQYDVVDSTKVGNETKYKLRDLSGKEIWTNQAGLDAARKKTASYNKNQAEHDVKQAKVEELGNKVRALTDKKKLPVYQPTGNLDQLTKLYEAKLAELSREKGAVKSIKKSKADISIIYPEANKLPSNLKERMPGNDVAITTKTVDGKELVITRADVDSKSNIITKLKAEAIRIAKDKKNPNDTTKYKNLKVKDITSEQMAELSTYVTGKPKLGTVDYSKNKPILKETKSLTQTETEGVVGSRVMPKTTISSIVKLLPEVAQGKNVTVTKDKGELYFSYTSKSGGATNTGKISAESMGLSQERLDAMGIKEGMTVDLSDVTKNTNKVPVIRNNKTNVEGMSVDTTSGQGSLKFNKDLSVKEERSRDAKGKYANETTVDSFKTILKNNVTGEIAKSADLKKEVQQYQGNSQNVNRWLATHDESSKFFESYTEMDAAFTQELTKPIKLYRTISEDFYGILEGNKIFTDKTYGSSTLSLQEARSAVYGDIILSFTVPAGQKVIVPDMYSGSIDTISQYSQTEFILPRNMTYEVTSVAEVDGRTMVQTKLVNSLSSTENTEAMATESTMSEAEAFKQRAQLTRKQVARDTLEEQTLSVKDAEKLESVNATIEFLSEYFTPIKRGRMRMRQALGEHHSDTEIIRIQKIIGDNIVEGGRLGVAVHEVGHNLAKNIPEFNITKGSGISILGKKGNADLSSISTKPNGAAMSGVYGEGFAEFIRYYVINPQALQQKMPETYKIINETLRDKYPHQYRGLMRARTMWNVDQKLSATKKVLSLISYSDKKPSLAQRTKDGLEKAYKNWVNDLYPIELLENMVEKSGVKLEMQDKASTMMMLHRGVYGKAKAFLEWGTFKLDPYSKNEKNGKYELEKSGKSFKEITQAIYQNGQETEFDGYLAAKRSLALWQDRGIVQPMSAEVAKEMIAQQEKKHPHFVQAQKELVKFQDAVIDYITESGMIAEENVKLMRQMNRDYVPLFKVMEDVARSGQMGKGYANLQSGLKKIKGSELQIVSPLESIVKNTYTLIQAADANRTMQAMANMSKVSPEIAGQIFEEVKTPMTKAATVKLSDLGIVSAEKSIGEGFTTDFDVDQAINLFRPLFRDDSGQVVSVMIEGKPKFYQVSDKAIYTALSEMNEQDAGIVTKVLTTPASLLRAGATLTPDFVFRNPVRDQFAAFVYSKTGYVPIFDTGKGFASVAAKDNDYWMWQISGGAYSTLVSVDRSYAKKETQKMLHIQPLRSKLNVLEGLRNVSELMEEATRMGEYREAIKDNKNVFVKHQAMHPLEAAMASKEITLNFQRRGTYGKQVNKVVAFFNAGVQDFDKLARELKTHPVRTTVKATLAITLPSILLFLANRDEEWYKEIPTWQKDTFFIFKVKGQIVRIPKPFLLGVIFSTLPERVLGELMDDDSRNMKGIGGYLQGALPDWIPTGIKPLVEVATNYDMFGNKPIVPRSEEYFDKSEQYGSYTSETAKILNQLTGNQLSPREWDHLIKGYTAGLGQYAVQTADTLMVRAGLVDRPDKPKGTTRNIPVIKGFTIDEPRGSGSQSVSNFYEASRKATTAETTYNKMIDEGRTKEAMEYKKSHPEADLAGQYRTIQKALSDLKNVAEKARTSKTMSPEEKSQVIAEAERQMTFIAKSALQFDPNYTKDAKTSRQPKSQEYDDKISEAAYNNDYQKARDLAEEHNRKIDEYVKDLGPMSKEEKQKWEDKKIKVTLQTLNRRRKYQQEKQNK